MPSDPSAPTAAVPAYRTWWAWAVAAVLGTQGVTIINRGPDELAAFQKQEMARWGENVKRFHIKVD